MKLACCIWNWGDRPTGMFCFNVLFIKPFIVGGGGPVYS